MKIDRNKLFEDVQQVRDSILGIILDIENDDTIKHEDIVRYLENRARELKEIENYIRESEQG